MNLGLPYKGSKNTIAVELVQSFNIHGLSHRYDTVLRCIEPLKFSNYGATQGQCLVSGSAAADLGSVCVTKITSRYTASYILISFCFY